MRILPPSRPAPRYCVQALGFFAVLASLAASHGAQGTVVAEPKISATSSGFGGILLPLTRFARGLARLGDVDGDGVTDLAVGVHKDDDGGVFRGACWVVFMNSDGTVKGEQKISDTQGGFTGVLNDFDSFGFSVAAPGDLDGDGVPDLVAGAPDDNEGGFDSGSIWVLFLNTDGTVKGFQKINSLQGGFTGSLAEGDFFGQSITSLGDLNGDGTVDLAVGAHEDDDGAVNAGAVWILFMQPGGTVAAQQEIGVGHGGFTGILDADDHFGFSVEGLGDFDGDGLPDVAVGSERDDDGGIDRGSAWLLYLDASGMVRAHGKISATSGGFAGSLGDDDHFGSSLATIGDLDSDGVRDLAVGAPLDDDGGIDRGATWLLFMNADGSVRTHQKVSETEGGFDPTLDDDDRFGIAVANVGDLDGNGTDELAVGASRDDDGARNAGAFYVLFLAPGGPSQPEANFAATPTSGAAPLTVSFSNASIGTIASWAWNFGDGSTASEASPTHVYQTDGTYTVSLAASGPGGTDLEVKPSFIVVSGVSQPLYYLSFAEPTDLPDVGTVEDEDVVIYDPTAGLWSLYFDGSDVGLTDDLDSIHVRADGDLLFSVDTDNVSLPDLSGGPNGTLVDNSDLIVFHFTSSGSSTGGSFEFLFDGSDVGLTTTLEAIDGMNEYPDGRLTVSLLGLGSVTGLTNLPQDEDVLLFTPSSLGSTTAGTWTIEFDGSDVGLATTGNEDIDAISFDGGDLLFSTFGTYAGAGSTGEGEDVSRFVGTLGSSTSGTASLVLDLSALGIDALENVDGLCFQP